MKKKETLSDRNAWYVFTFCRKFRTARTRTCQNFEVSGSFKRVIKPSNHAGGLHESFYDAIDLFYEYKVAINKYKYLLLSQPIRVSFQQGNVGGFKGL